MPALRPASMQCSSQAMLDVYKRQALLMLGLVYKKLVKRLDV